ncbi:hypothetical protein Btru_064658 [Bulinus truncatus]|nr:hypothetical protein Btru_064658 [Bulinus truncatus]
MRKVGLWMVAFRFQKQGGSIHIKATRTRCIKEDSVVKKLSTVIILLHFVNLQKFSASENWLDFETSNSELSKILSKCNANDDFKMFLKNLDTLFGKSSYRMNKTIQSVLNENSVDLLSRTTKDLWGKDLPITLATVFQCFKKLFKTMDIKLINTLEECLIPRSIISLGQPSLNPLVATVLFHALTHFVTFCLREATHSKIHEICVKVLKLIDSLSKQQSTYEVSLAHQALIFDPSPDIRQGAISLLQKRNLYEKKIDSFLTKELENLLCPYLSVESTINSSDGKLCLTGKFHVTPVIITVLKQTVAELTGEKLSPLHTSDCRQFKNMVDNESRLNHKHIVKLFAYRSNTNVPQFAVREHHTTNLQYSLAYRNRRRIYYPEKTLLVYLLQTISALEYCHSKNIVHCNLTAASIYVAREDQIMLGEFTISVNLKANKDSVLGQDDLNSIPLRWSALETLQNKVVSKETDIAMAGNLMYEVLSHGALPYSRDNISDEEYASKAIYYHLQLHRETCFKEEYYQLMLKCTHYCPRKRPKVSELKSELQHFLNTYGCDDVTCTTHIYPDFENDTLKTSVNFTKGIPSSKKGYVTPILPKLSKVINSTIHLFNLGQFILLQEIIQRDLSTKLIEKVQEGALDNVVPKVNSYCLEHGTFVFDIFLPASCSDVLTLIESKDLCRTPESCTRLLISVAEMLLKVHQKQLVLGELRASNLFVDLTNGEIKVHPISLKYLDKGVAHLKGPEVAQIPTNSTEMDIYRFGILMRDIYNKIDELNDLENLYATIPYDDDQILRETVRPSSCPEAVHCLMLRCLNESPQKRPWLDDIIRRLNLELNRLLWSSSDSSISSSFSSSTVQTNSTIGTLSILNRSDSTYNYEAHSCSIHYASFQECTKFDILNPSDDEHCNDEETSVKQLNVYEETSVKQLNVSQKNKYIKLKSFRNNHLKKGHENSLSGKIYRKKNIKNCIQMNQEVHYSTVESKQGKQQTRPLPPLPGTSLALKASSSLTSGQSQEGNMDQKQEDSVDQSQEYFNVGKFILVPLACMIDSMKANVSLAEADQEGHSDYDSLNPNPSADEQYHFVNLQEETGSNTLDVAVTGGDISVTLDDYCMYNAFESSDDCSYISVTSNDNGDQTVTCAVIKHLFSEMEIFV